MENISVTTFHNAQQPQYYSIAIPYNQSFQNIIAQNNHPTAVTSAGS